MQPISMAEALAFQVEPAEDLSVPATCHTCDGLGYVRIDVSYGHADFGKITSCPDCNGADAALFDRIWAVSGLLRDEPRPPRLRDFATQHDERAAAMRAAALAFVAKPQGWLTICGNGRDGRGDGRWGAGKSHLAEAMARELLVRGIPALYINAPELFRYLGCVWRNPGDEIDFDRRMAWVIQLPVLIVDQFNTEPKSESVELRRMELLNARYVAATRDRGGATVLVSNDHPTAWQDPAIKSRALDWRFVQVEAAAIDFRQVER